jgi:hypothetical protein
MSMKASGQKSSLSSSRFTLKDEQSGHTWPLDTNTNNAIDGKNASSQPITFAVVPGR